VRLAHHQAMAGQGCNQSCLNKHFLKTKQFESNFTRGLQTIFTLEQASSSFEAPAGRKKR